MDEKTVKELLEARIRKGIEGLDGAEQGSDRYRAMTADLGRLIEAYVQLDKEEFLKEDAERKFREEIRQKDLERDYRDILERDKMEREYEDREKERKLKEKIEDRRIESEKKSGLRDMCARTGVSLLQLAAYAAFTGLGMRLEYIDRGAITGFTLKELFRVLHPKPTVM